MAVTGYPLNGHRESQAPGFIVRNWQLILCIVVYLFTAGMTYQQVQEVRIRQDKAEVQANTDRATIHTDIERLRNEMQRRYDVIFDDLLKKNLQ